VAFASGYSARCKVIHVLGSHKTDHVFPTIVNVSAPGDNATPACHHRPSRMQIFSPQAGQSPPMLQPLVCREMLSKREFAQVMTWAQKLCKTTAGNQNLVTHVSLSRRLHKASCSAFPITSGNLHTDVKEGQLWWLHHRLTPIPMNHLLLSLIHSVKSTQPRFSAGGA
jgi:hypothetical protein